MSHVFRPLAALAAAIALVPALGAQSATESTTSLVTIAPAGAIAAPHVPVSIPSALPVTWSASLARADSLSGRKRAFHIGALAGAVAASGYMLAVMQPWDEGGCESGPDGRTVAAVMLVSAIPGALLGGFAGVIVHDIHGAITR